MGAQQDIIDDIWQDAFIIFDRNVRQGKFRQESSIHTYITSITKWCFLNYIRKQTKIDLREDIRALDFEDTYDFESSIINEERKSILRKLIQKLNAECKELLEMYIDQYTMAEIMEAKAYSNIQSAKNAIHRCRTKLRDQIKFESL